MQNNALKKKINLSSADYQGRMPDVRKVIKCFAKYSLKICLQNLFIIKKA